MLRASRADIKKGVSKEFKPYETSFGIKLSNLEEALEFAALHEGLHSGYALAMKKHF